MQKVILELLQAAVGAFVLGAFIFGLAILLSGCAPLKLVSDCLNRTIGCA